MSESQAYVAQRCPSRHFDGSMPFATHSVTYGCRHEHVVSALACDRCLASLSSGVQRCAVCLSPMVVTDSTPSDDSGAPS